AAPARRDAAQRNATQRAPIVRGPPPVVPIRRARMLLAPGADRRHTRGAAPADHTRGIAARRRPTFSPTNASVRTGKGIAREPASGRRVDRSGNAALPCAARSAT
ncbi:hypothetical protein, partial [Burkholderia pseudomallei]|uniref:hypothetical protein n=2 Tax=Burkholderia pseudomallei TaxID=28450 RepID=UPI003AF74BB2